MWCYVLFWTASVFIFTGKKKADFFKCCHVTVTLFKCCSWGVILSHYMLFKSEEEVKGEKNTPDSCFIPPKLVMEV